jgi:hypothetical protein
MTDRQTRDEINHPTYGPCVAVYNNGPSRLELPDGKAVACAYPLYGWSKESGSRLSIGGQRCEVRRWGDTHQRMWSPVLGLGWLVALGKRNEMRFEGDDGRRVTFFWSQWEIALAPENRHLRGKKREAHRYTDEDCSWVVYKCTDGAAFVFREGGPPPPAGSAVAAADTSPAGPPQNMIQQMLPGFA